MIAQNPEVKAVPRAKIVIDRPCNVVWDFYTTTGNWKKWHGAALEKVDPCWKTGAILVWKSGERSTLALVVPQKEIQIAGRFMRVTRRFTPLDERSTLVELEASPTGGAFFSDGGAAHEKQMATELARLKGCVENETV